MTTGILAGVLKLLGGTKAVVEIVTAPELVYLSDREKPGFRERFLHFYSDACLHISAVLADRVHLLYPDALSHYPRLNRKASAVFHEFVPVSRIRCCRESAGPEKFLLLVGAPWFPKGVDLLIETFHEISREFPDLKLKLLGHYEDRRGLEALIGDSTRIEILKPRPNPETLEIISAATAMVLPSRCEGMPRVLLEAMAAGVPVIASGVGGIPWLLRGGDCGLVLPLNDACELAKGLRELLSNDDLARRVSGAGYRRAHSELNETNYVQRFTAMIQATAREAV
jgi:glycosyltransferase involved in cell wall biosynthesis